MKKKPKYLSLKQIDKLLENRESLTDEQKTQIRDSIYLNPEANRIAIVGALSDGNFPLAGNFLINGQYIKKKNGKGL